MTKTELIRERGHRCEDCGNTTWKFKPIPLEIHHVNPPSEAERDLQLVCPNCHASTPNYRGRGIRTSKTISDEQIVEAANNANNLRQVLVLLDLAPKGGNYEVLRKRLKSLDLYAKFKPKLRTRYCLKCGDVIPISMRFCSNTCSNQFNTDRYVKKTKIAWPAIEVVASMVKGSGYCEAGRQLGVSDNAVRKFLKTNTVTPL